MSIFGKILTSLGLKKEEETPKPAAPQAPKPANVRPTLPVKPAQPLKPAASVPPAPKPGGPAVLNPHQGNVMPQAPRPVSSMQAPSDAAYSKPAPAPTPVPMVDVVSKLDSLAAANPQKLSWKNSIVDLLKLLDIDSSLSARKELAAELGCPPDKMGGDYSAMNIWLHKAVLQKIAENGGNVPRELLD